MSQDIKIILTSLTSIRRINPGIFRLWDSAPYQEFSTYHEHPQSLVMCQHHHEWLSLLDTGLIKSTAILGNALFLDAMATVTLRISSVDFTAHSPKSFLFILFILHVIVNDVRILLISWHGESMYKHINIWSHLHRFNFCLWFKNDSIYVEHQWKFCGIQVPWDESFFFGVDFQSGLNADEKNI